MTEFATLSKNIVRLGTRSYRQRMETLSGQDITIQTLRRLNKDLDDLYEFLYAHFNSITESEARSISPILQELLKSVKALCAICRKSGSKSETAVEVDRLSMNWSALQEMHDDIRNYRVSSDKDDELRRILAQTESLKLRIS